MNHEAMTGTNHNKKDLRHQDLVGGRMVKSIVSELINGGIVKDAGINIETWIVKD